MHIYDVTGVGVVSGANQLLRPLGTGAFHAGVEVYGQEYSFGYCEEESGIFCCDPTECEEHKYRETIQMGETSMSPDEVGYLIDDLSASWLGNSYDLLRRNCCHFSDGLCVALGVGHLPGWVLNLAGASATVMDGFNLVSSRAQAAAIVAAAKAGEIDDKYNISGQVVSTAVDLHGLLQAFDAKATVSHARAQAARIKATAKERGAPAAVVEVGQAAAAQAAVAGQKAAGAVGGLFRAISGNK